MIVQFRRGYDPVFINPAHIVTVERAWPKEYTRISLVVGQTVTVDHPIEEVAKLLGYHGPIGSHGGVDEGQGT